MKYAYTICSANYLPYAKIAADSCIKHNKGYTFIIVLADTYNIDDVSFFSPHVILPVSQIQIDTLAEMNSRYDMFELSCALKPYVAEHLFKTRPDCELLLYFDSDIVIYNSLHYVESVLENHPIALTPHVTSASPYAVSIDVEIDILRAGIYNAGFFGLKRNETVFLFLNWWKDRLRFHCTNTAMNGLFVDQIWLNLVPLYFESTFVLSDPGYNLAYWNFHERTLMQRNGSYYVNEVYPLVFFHFSGFDIHQPEKISKHQKDSSFTRWPVYHPLFRDYASKVNKNNVHALLDLVPAMGKSTVNTKDRLSFRRIGRFFKK
ncbi:MAG TPA: hypothetical protein VGN63_13430 [Flavisolibacter sp.]|nr:hypothetical protein [Flavisolibacter sp.]